MVQLHSANYMLQITWCKINKCMELNKRPKTQIPMHISVIKIYLENPANHQQYSISITRKINIKKTLNKSYIKMSYA